MNKIPKMISSLLVAALIAVPISAEGLHWYCKSSENQSQPPLPSEFSFIEDYSGIYIDREHGDNNDEKVIYLTFDVGYENGNVAKTLDILKKHNAHGTFFVLANVIKRETALVNRMFDEGHTVANHTMSHKNMANADRATFESELHGLEELCLEATGKEMAKLYRPPEGSFSLENMKILSDMGYKTIFWSCAYADWDNNKQPTREYALNKLNTRLHNGEILLLHPTSATNAAILDEFLTSLEAKGYKFGKIEDICER